MKRKKAWKKTCEFSSSSRTAVFFPAEDGIRDRNVTGVQTCALPISAPFVEQEPRALDVARLDRQLDGGDVMAELAEAERDVERGDVESEREQRVQRVEQSMQHGAPSRRRYHRDQPRDDAMAALAAVERLL